APKTWTSRKRWSGPGVPLPSSRRAQAARSSARCATASTDRPPGTGWRTKPSGSSRGSASAVPPSRPVAEARGGGGGAGAGAGGGGGTGAGGGPQASHPSARAARATRSELEGRMQHGGGRGAGEIAARLVAHGGAPADDEADAHQAERAAHG